MKFEKPPIRRYNTTSLCPLLVTKFSVGDHDDLQRLVDSPSIRRYIGHSRSLISMLHVPFTENSTRDQKYSRTVQSTIDKRILLKVRSISPPARMGTLKNYDTPNTDQNTLTKHCKESKCMCSPAFSYPLGSKKTFLFQKKILSY